MGEIRDSRGIAPTTVAQIYRRADGRYTFRWHDGRKYRYARELFGHDLGWLTVFDTERAARGKRIKSSVDITDEWDEQRCA